ncbi:MAG TPA: ribulose-phosphate 3-epimerase [Candidatus Krumholzibacteria bacterium]|nr:ribulose-phosphate 3-epimerase [Candidatus Krumholzibacteria bacterium]
MSWWLPNRTEPKVAVAPSLLSADLLHLAEEMEDAQDAGADLFHLDIMDGHFVDNLSYGPHFARAICKTSRIPVDCHLMVEDPLDYAMRFLDAGVSCVSFHLELPLDHGAIVRQIQKKGGRAGLALNPASPLREREHRALFAGCDLFLVMSVHPGFAGQAFDRSVLPKIEQLRAWREADGHGCVLEIDGGIDAETAPLAREAGAEILVSGSSFFGSQDYPAITRSLRGA